MKQYVKLRFFVVTGLFLLIIVAYIVFEISRGLESSTSLIVLLVEISPNIIALAWFLYLVPKTIHSLKLFHKKGTIIEIDVFSNKIYLDNRVKEFDVSEIEVYSLNETGDAVTFIVDNRTFIVKKNEFENEDEFRSVFCKESIGFESTEIHLFHPRYSSVPAVLVVGVIGFVSISMFSDFGDFLNENDVLIDSLNSLLLIVGFLMSRVMVKKNLKRK